MKNWKERTEAEREELRAASRRATERAQAFLKPGDRVSRTICGGAKGTFTFTNWRGSAACGKSIDDCPAGAIYAVNGKPVDFYKETAS